MNRRVAGLSRNGRPRRQLTTQATINLLALAPYSGDSWLRLPAVVAMTRRSRAEQERRAVLARPWIPTQRPSPEGVPRGRPAGHL